MKALEPLMRTSARWQWLPVMDRAVVEQFGLHGRPDLFVLGLAALFGIFALPPIARFTNVGATALAMLWLVLATWMLTVHRCCYARALESRIAFNILVFGNVAAGTVVTVGVVAASGTSETPLWLGYCVMACINGATESQPSILLGVFHLLAPLTAIPFFEMRKENHSWVAIGPIVCSLISGYGYQFLSRRGQRWRLERHQREMQEARQRFEASERERRRLARELHDTVGAALSLVVLYCSRAQHDAQTAMQAQAASAMQEIARTGLHELRSFLDALPQSPKTLRELAEGMLIIAGRTTDLAGAKLGLEIHAGADAVVSGESRTVLVRVFHEAVLNAVRHGAAKQIKASLEVTDRALKLKVMDDGMGFAVDAPTGGFGLAGMQERAHELGGALQVSTIPGSGTTIELALPAGKH